MTASRLLALYPRPWRDRYGDEFLETVGTGALRLQQVIDIVAGAIDAHLSSDVRRAARQPSLSNGGQTMSVLSHVCRSGSVRFTTRDGLWGAAAMIGSSLLFLVLGIALRRNGWLVTGEILKGIAFPASMMLSMPFTFLKGQPWRAQAVIVGGTLTFLILIGWLSTKI